MTRTTDRRAAFTLVELLVAAAICVIIMTVLTVCFQTGTDAIRQMRAQGDMMTQLRAAGEVLRRDLNPEVDHFAEVSSNAPQPNPFLPGRKLSDYDYSNTANPPTGIRGGFYRIYSPASMSEGTDSDGFISTRADGHVLQFTSIQPFTQDTPAYSATVSGVNFPFTSRAAEVAYFLGPATGQTAGGLNLYNLYRRQRLVALSASDASYLVQGLTADTTASEVISSTNGTTANTLGDLTNSANRMAAAAYPVTSSRYGNDILLSNVISFEVKATWTPAAGTPGPRPFSTTGLAPQNTLDNDVTNYPNTSDNPYDTLFQITGSEFDTTSTTNPPKIRVHGVMVRVRVYDPKLQTARQATFVFDQ